MMWDLTILYCSVQFLLPSWHTNSHNDGKDVDTELRIHPLTWLTQLLRVSNQQYSFHCWTILWDYTSESSCYHNKSFPISDRKIFKICPVYTFCSVTRRFILHIRHKTQQNQSLCRQLSLHWNAAQIQFINFVKFLTAFLAFQKMFITDC